MIQSKREKSIFANAFTLSELLIIIGIIGILTLIGFPIFKLYQPTLELNGAVRNLVSDLRYIQQLAVTEQVEHSIYFIQTEKKYQIRRYGIIISTIKEVSFPETITEVTISGLTDMDTNKEARYNPYGAVKDSGLVVLKNSKNITTTIDIRPSGFVKIID